MGGFLIVPMQDGISKAGSWLSTRSEELVEIRSLIQENEELKQKVDELTMENISLQQDRYELTNLRQLYELDSQYDEYQKIGARIIACLLYTSVKGNNSMDRKEMETLIDELLTLENPYHCPHGRPTIITMSKYEIEKKFKRIVT